MRSSGTWETRVTVCIWATGRERVKPLPFTTQAHVILNEQNRFRAQTPTVAILQYPCAPSRCQRGQDPRDNRQLREARQDQRCSLIQDELLVVLFRTPSPTEITSFRRQPSIPSMSRPATVLPSLFAGRPTPVVNSLANEEDTLAHRSVQS